VAQYKDEVPAPTGLNVYPPQPNIGTEAQSVKPQRHFDIDVYVLLSPWVIILLLVPKPNGFY